MPQDQNDEQEEPKVRTRQQESPSEPVDVGAQVRSILGEMARSGELLRGGESDSEPGQGGAASPSPSFDIEGAVARVLEKRDSEGKAEQERKALHDRIDRLENPPKKRQWGKPWSPFGG